MSSNSRRVRSRLRSPTNAWKRSERISTSPAVTGLVSMRPADDALDACDDLLGMTRLRHPVVGAEAQTADALSDRRGSGADHDSEVRQGAAETLEPLPRLRAEHGQIDDERTEAHRADDFGGYRAAQHPMLPAQTVEALAEHLEETAVTVEHGDAKRRDRRRRGAASVWLATLLGASAIHHRVPQSMAPWSCWER
jgi:hypothetical protein